MNHVSLELIPRTQKELESDLDTARKYRDISAVNIPDSPRFPIRSWDAAHTAARFFPKAIPHLRASGISPENRAALLENLIRTGIKTILVIHGDIPNAYESKVFATTTLEIIEWLRKKLPDVDVYAALDPYRSGLRHELAYARDKISAGASGFFTQPFFDLRLIEVWAEHLESIDVFWGVAPVVSDKSRVGYWEVKNRVLFPKNFRATLEWNQELARTVIEWTQKHHRSHAYLMPIRIDIDSYLAGVFA